MIHTDPAVLIQPFRKAHSEIVGCIDPRAPALTPRHPPQRIVGTAPSREQQMDGEKNSLHLFPHLKAKMQAVFL